MKSPIEYIPYSKRNGIDNPFTAKLTDHLERVVGWDIDTVNSHSEYTAIIAKQYKIFIFE
jgi:hypothetical protein